MTKQQTIEFELVTRAVRTTTAEGANLVLRNFARELRDSLTQVDHADILRALKELFSQDVINLQKWDITSAAFRSYAGETDDQSFFLTGDFRIKRTAFSWSYLETLVRQQEELRLSAREMKPVRVLSFDAERARIKAH